MKQTIIILLAIIALSFSNVWAEDGNERDTEPNYKVTIKIVYNSVSESESNRLARTIKVIHSKACKVEISSEKLEPSGTFWISSDGSVTITE